MSVSGPAVLTISIPTGFALSESQRQMLTNDNHLNVWTTDSDIVIFFEKVLLLLYLSVVAVFLYNKYNSLTLFYSSRQNIPVWISL